MGPLKYTCAISFVPQQATKIHLNLRVQKVKSQRIDSCFYHYCWSTRPKDRWKPHIESKPNKEEEKDYIFDQVAIWPFWNCFQKKIMLYHLDSFGSFNALKFQYLRLVKKNIQLKRPHFFKYWGFFGYLHIWPYFIHFHFLNIGLIESP